MLRRAALAVVAVAAVVPVLPLVLRVLLGRYLVHLPEALAAAARPAARPMRLPVAPSREVQIFPAPLAQEAPPHPVALAISAVVAVQRARWLQVVTAAALVATAQALVSLAVVAVAVAVVVRRHPRPAVRAARASSICTRP